VKDLGSFNFFLGIALLPYSHGVILSQQRYILDILKCINDISSTEVEYKALANTAAELSWLISLRSKIGILFSQPPTLWYDSIGATHLSSNQVFHARKKHVEIDFHFVKDMIAKKSLSIKFIFSKYQLADIFTKPLSSSRFSILRSKLNVTTAPFSFRGCVNDIITSTYLVCDKVNSNSNTQDSLPDDKDSNTHSTSTDDKDRSQSSSNRI
jgi:hypothetical protein